MTEQNLWSMARLGECDDMFCKEQDVVQACIDLQKRCVKELAGLMRYPKKFSRCTTKLSPEDDQTYRKMMELLDWKQNVSVQVMFELRHSVPS